MGGRASGWVVRDIQGVCKYICLCGSVYVNMYMCMVSQFLLPKLISSQFGSLQEFANSFSYVI